jgi:CDP-4-dehydro-6-deoxyglucose reductase
VRKLPVRVAKLDKVADDVIILSLQLPANDRLQYKAGQYVEFLLRDGKRRSYSMATPRTGWPDEPAHPPHAGRLFTDQVFTTLKERDILRIEGPLGTFFLREDSDKPIILLASGTGFAPIKAIVEQLNMPAPRARSRCTGAAAARRTCT